MSLRTPAPDSVYEFGEFRFEPGNARLTRGGEPLHAQPKALRVLGVLIENAGALVDRDALFELVWEGVVVTPGALTRLIVELRRLLDDAAGEPRFIETVHTRGYRWIAAAPHATAKPKQTNLPQRTIQLIGRDADLARAQQLLNDARLVTLAGPGGSGKTQLALELGRRLAAEPRAVAWVDFSSAADALHCGRLVAAAVDVRERENLSLEAGLARAIGPRELVLVLDNCEVVVRPVAALARMLLGGCAGLRIVCTSQVTLDVPDEIVHWVRPLRVPAEDWTSDADPSAELLAFDAARLLVERARALTPEFRIDRRNAPALAAICRRLDGLPLALELAAARLAALTPQRLLDALDDRFGLLERRVADPEARFRSLAAAIEWSYGLLDAREQDVLDSFGVFAGSFSIEAARAVGEPEAGSPLDLLNVVQSLAQKSLLTVERGETEIRYRLLDSLKAFARGRLAARGRDAEVQRRHGAFHAALAREAGAALLGPEQLDWLERLNAAWPDLTAAHEWARRPGGSLREAVTLATGLRWYFWTRGMYVEGVQWFHGHRELAAAVSAAERAALMNGLAINLFHVSRYREAAEAAREAARAAAAAAMGWELSFARSLLAWIAVMDPTLSAESSEPAVAVEPASDPWSDAFSRMGSAFESILGERHAKALEKLAAIRSTLAATGERHLTMFVLAQEALQCTLSRRLDDARRAILSCVDLALEFSNVRTLAGGIECSAYLAIEAGDPALGARLLGTAEAARESSGSPLFRQWDRPHREAVERAREALGEDGFEAARSAGRKLGMREAAGSVRSRHAAELSEAREERAGRGARGKRQRS